MIKASSLIEVIVALLIIMIVFASSTMLYVKVINSNPGKKYRLQKRMLAIASEIKQDSSVTYDQYEDENGIVIFQYREAYRADSVLFYLKLEAVESNKTVAIHEEIYLKSQNASN